MYFPALPDLHYTIDDLVVGADLIASRYTATATHQGELMGIPPTGKQATWTGIIIHRFADGKIVEEWIEWDTMGMMQQLGVIPATGNENYTWGEPSEVTGEPGDPEANKAILRRITEEALNQRNLSLVDEFYATDYVFHLPGTPDIHGPEGFKQYFSTAFAAFPDFHLTTEDMIAEEDKVVSRVTIRGTHKGEFMGIPPTGKEVTATGILIQRFADGKIVEDWESFDFLGFMQQLTPPPVDTEANKALIRRAYEEILNQNNLSVADEIVAADCVLHIPPYPDIHTLEGYKQFVTTNSTAFPDGQYTIEELIAEGDKVAVRWTTLGTHTGEFMGLPPTGKQVKVTAIVIDRIAEGKIVEEWANVDFLGLMQQLGVIPPDSEDFSWGMPSEVTGDPGDPEANKAILHRVLEEVLNQKNLDLADEFYATSYVNHIPPNPEIRGPEGFKQLFAMQFAAFPDFHLTIEDMFAEGDKVVSRGTFLLGTHTGEFMGIPPTGKQVTVTGILIQRFADGKIVEDWGNYDVLGLMQQLGVIPPPEE